MINIAVLLGGSSSERDISLISGREVINNLDKNKYRVMVYDPKTDLNKLICDKNKIDVAFPILHGKGGEDGAIQGILELLKIPYIGSGILASALAMNKEKAKEIYSLHNILTPQYKVLKNNEKEKIDKIKFPCVVKPISHGSSVGTSIVFKENELMGAIDLAFTFQNQIIIEEYIKGIEITVAVLGNDDPKALPVIEIVPPEGKFFDREVKYNGKTKEIIPARISQKITEKAKEIGIKAHQALGCRGLSRTDMIIQNSKFETRNSKLYVLETNTMPGMTKESLFPKAAKVAGIEFKTLLDKLIEFALQ